MFDYELWEWGRLKFSPARHLSTPDTPLFRQGVNPRVIDDPVWLKLVWASLNLRQEDLLSEIHYPLYAAGYGSHLDACRAASE
ncbi:hypothetical protein IVY21_06105 [Salmonella enterica subsp. enterica serovar Worthington]|nr:hypothetical protein [Salmonella enterica subsp. enterica serovar Worthington]